MFRFTANGRVGSINQYKNNTVSISLAADRLLEGRDGQFTVTEWIRCVSFDADLNKRLLTDLEKGQSVTLQGRLVPRLREKTTDKKVYETTLEITGFERGAKPRSQSEQATGA